MMHNYLKTVIGRIYKLLPLREDYELGKDNKYMLYVRSLSGELNGSLNVLPDLKSNPYYIQAISIVNYLADNETDMKFFKSQVFRAVNLIDYSLKEGVSND